MLKKFTKIQLTFKHLKLNDNLPLNVTLGNKNFKKYNSLTSQNIFFGRSVKLNLTFFA